LFVHPYFNVVLSWPAQGIHSGYRRHLRMANIWLVLACPRNSFGLAESSSHNDHFCNNASEGFRHHFLWANRDIIAWQHSTCLGPP
jgi:hypothetical protein